GRHHDAHHPGRARRPRRSGGQLGHLHARDPRRRGDLVSALAFDDVAIGDALPATTITVGRADLVRYAGASGDFNPIHWNARFAQGVGLPDVIAHGMLTMALAVTPVTEWSGDPGAVV